MATKQFPPSERKLQQLRMQGQFAFSQDVVTFALLVALGLVAWWTVDALLPRLIEFAEERWQGSEASWSEVRSILALGFGVIVLPLAVAALLSGLLQSRFLLRFGLLSFNPGRIFAFTGRFGRHPGTLAMLVKVTAYVLICGALIGYLFLDTGQLQELLGDDSRVLPAREAGAKLRVAWLYLTLASFAIAAISYTLSVLRFRAAHWMSRAELEAELREEEVSQSIRDARAARREE